MHEIIKRALKEKRYPTEPECRKMLEDYNIPVLDYRVAKSEEEAVEAAEELGYPVVMKIVSSKGVHKSDIGGVVLDIKSKDELMNAFKKLTSLSSEGVLISPMVRGIELFVGAFQDEQFGGVVAFGTGGKFVEVYKDVSYRITPIDKEEALRMIKETKVYRILSGYRDEKPRDIEKIAELLVNLSRLVEENPEIKEIDLNPTFSLPEGVFVADARFIL
ncbi:acetate--CoA ligase family protein [Ferroglobus sp.]|uniref:acetate--CoA ligase family protein n=1 Tax=Ferroglobus sp. TaxID=2614230 RepID=UPI0025C7394E|nr:acetate--CoA ligase family protein [Ferroglobus sp.]